MTDNNDDRDGDGQFDESEAEELRERAERYTRMALEAGAYDHDEVTVVEKDGGKVLRQGGDVILLDDADAAEVSGGDGAPRPAVGSVLEEAERIAAERQEEYGPPDENMAAIARLWDAYVKNLVQRHWGVEPEDGVQLVSSTDAAQMMTQLKQARFQTGAASRDHFVDGAGYQRVAAEVEGVNGGDE